MRASLARYFARFGAIAMQASHSATHRRDRLVEHLLLGLVEVDLDDALDAAGADHGRHADIGVLDAVLALKDAPRRAARASCP